MRGLPKGRGSWIPVLPAVLVWVVCWGCGATGGEPGPPASAARAERPSILLVTLDTTRADRLGIESGTEATPNLDALAARGVYFSQAYSTVPTTLPSHTSMLTGSYPAKHGVRENARRVPEQEELLAERLRALGYRTAAFVSGYPLAAQFGLARGFDHYDDLFGEGAQGSGAAQRRAEDTVDAALGELARAGDAPLFLWAHFYDPHEPYAPPEPFRSAYERDPYLGEIAYMDREVGRLVEAFEARTKTAPVRILVIADHGEGLGDHGEALHGNLLYQETMRVPLIVAGTGISTARVDVPVSSRRVFDTVLAWAGEEMPNSLLAALQASSVPEPVLGEAMKPFLQYGWQPQVMAVDGDLKVIRSGELEVYDLRADPGELRDLAGTAELSRALREALRAYPFLPEPASATDSSSVSQEDRERLASLGYVGWEGRTVLRDDAPSPRDMTHLFADLDLGSGLFVRGRYPEAIELFERVAEEDPNNLMVAVRLAVASSLLGRDRDAIAAFDRARRIDPTSADARHYLALHHCRRGQWREAEPLLVSVLAQDAQRLAAIECLAEVRREQGRVQDAATLLERAVALAPESVDLLATLGQTRMMMRDTPGAIRAFERARDAAGGDFAYFLDLGVCYLAQRRLTEARDALDAVPESHPGYGMALFKRAQVSVLLGEPDAEARASRAYRAADPELKSMIEQDSLFRDLSFP